MGWRGKRGIALILGVCAAAMATAAHAEGTLTGVITDEAGAPVANAGVVISREGETEILAAATSDSEGRLRIEALPEGALTVTVTAPGFAPLERSLFVGTRNELYSLGSVTLFREDEDVVTVRAQAQRDIVLKPGVASFDIGDNAVAQSGTALEAMRGLPGITIDQEGEVLLRGSDKVTILLNGEPSGLTGIGRQSGLDSIPAANIERVEIITNPSARYGSQGSAGIINIVLKEEARLGWSGDFGLRAGIGALSRRRDDLPTDLGSYSANPKVTPFFNLGHGGEKTNSFLQGELLLQERLPNNEFTTRFYDDGRIIEQQVPENRSQWHLILKGGIDREMGENGRLSIGSVFDFESHTDEAEVPFINVVTGQRERFWFWTEEEDTGHFSVNADYTHTLGAEGHEISTRIEYIRGWEDEQYFLNEISNVRVGDDSFHLIAEENTLPITVDYVRPFGDGRLELGAKAQFRWLPITYEIDPGVGSIIYPGLGDESDWTEDIYAGYVNFVREKPGWAVEFGLRAEQTDVSYTLPEENIYYPESDAYDYFRFFPNVRLTAKLGTGTEVSAFYNERVDRPGEPELRIFPKYDDPELLKVGNPYLRPQFTDNAELTISHGFSKGSFSASAYYRQITDAYQRVFAQDLTNPNYDIVNKIYQNTGDATNQGAEFIGTWRHGGWLQLLGSVNVFRSEIDAADVVLLFPTQRPFTIEGSEGTAWDAKLNAEFDLPAGWKGNLQGLYYSDRPVPQGTESARSSIDFGLTRAFDDGKWEFSLTGTDIFNNFGIERELRGDGFTALYQNFYETQVFTAGLKRKF